MNRDTTTLNAPSSETYRRWIVPAACLLFAAITVLAYVVSTMVGEPSETEASLMSSTVELSAAPSLLRSHSAGPPVSAPNAATGSISSERAKLMLGPQGTIEIGPEESDPSPSRQKSTTSDTRTQTTSLPSQTTDTTVASRNMPVTALTQSLSETQGDPSEQADTYRGLLASSGLEASSVNDEALAELGAAVCLMAKLADSPNAYEQSRSEWVDATTPGSTLNQSEMEAAVDAVTRAYCPDVADRLAIAEAM